MTDATLLPFDLSAVRRKKLTADFSGGNQSSNGGLLLLRIAERKVGVCGRLVDSMPDRRDASRIRHAMFEMVMARVCAIACGHEDAIDLDRLRHDPLMKVAASLAGSPQHLYENVYCQRGRMENLIKLHKAQLASDRMSCHSATANQVRLVLHTAAFWLMHGVRAAIPRTSPLAGCEFTTIRDRLIKIGARVIEYIARIRVQMPTSCLEGALFRTVALGLMRSGP